MDLSRQKLVFVTGKGGVGKSTFAAAIALQEAQSGRRVLLAELGDSSFYSHFFNLNIEFKPTTWQKGVDIALLDGDNCLKDYVLHFLKVERLYKLFFANRVMRTLIHMAPGLSELSILGKLTSKLRGVGPQWDYDLIVVDTYATGHALALFRAPKGMSESIGLGPMGEQSRQMIDILKNPEMTAYVVVTLTDELPTAETLELVQKLKEEFSVSPLIICNRQIEIPAGVDEKQMADSSYFLNYLKQIVEKQEKNIKKLVQTNFEILKVPLLTEYRDSQDLIERIIQQVSKV